MGLDTSIPMQVRAPRLADLVDDFSGARADQRKDVAARRQGRLADLQLDDAERGASENKTIRGLMQVGDTTTPEGQNQFLEDLHTVGLGHRAPEFQNQFAQQAAARTQAQENAAKTKGELTGQALNQTKEVQDWFNRQAVIHGNAALSATDPGQREAAKQALLGKIKSYASTLPKDSPLQNSLQQEYDSVTGTDFSKDENLQAFATATISDPKDLMQYHNLSKWMTLKPILDNATQLTPKEQERGFNQAAYSTKVEAAKKLIPPGMMGMPEVKEYLSTLEKMKPNPPPNMAGMMGAPVPNSVLDNAAKRIANHQSTLSEELSKGRWMGQTAMQVHDELVNRVAGLDPNYSEQGSEAGAAYAKNPKTRTAIQQLDNAYSTVKRLQDVFSKLDNGQFPTLNKAINAGKVQMGDVNAAQAMIAQILGNDELTQAFARGGTGSDKLRGMSEALANPNLAPKQMAAQFQEILAGVKRSRQAYETQGGGYINPMADDSPAGAGTPGASGNWDSPAPVKPMQAGEVRTLRGGISIKKIH
jgi:hypothetical protein